MKVCDFVKVDRSGLLRGTWAPSWAQESVSRASDTVVAGRWPGWHLKNCGGEKGGSCLGKEHQLSFGDSRCRVWEGRQQVSEGLNESHNLHTNSSPYWNWVTLAWRTLGNCPLSSVHPLDSQLNFLSFTLQPVACFHPRHHKCTLAASCLSP